MSRLDVAAMTRPEKGSGNGNLEEFPDVNIEPDGFSQVDLGQGKQQQEAEAEPPAMEKYLKGIHDQISGAQQGQLTQQQQLLNQLGQDPLIRQVLEAKQQGKKIKLVDDQADDPIAQLQNIKEEEVDWNALSQDPSKFAQQLQKSMGTAAIKSMVPLMQNMLKQQLAPVGQMAQILQQLNQQVGQLQQERVGNEMSQVRSKAPELFDKLKPVMSELLNQYPTMSYEDLFGLAKLKTGVSEQTAQQLGSERPTQSTTGRGPMTNPNPRQQALLQQPDGRRLSPNAMFNQQLANILNQKNFSHLEH